MQPFDFALTDAYLPFTTSFALMCGIGLVEAVGLGLGSLDLDMDHDVHTEIDSTMLSWLGLANEMPILIWLTSLLACYTVGGFAIQQGAEALLSGPLEWPVAAASAAPAALFLNFFAANGLHRVLPKTETTVILTESLLGRRGTLIGCDAAPGLAARAKIVDQHGQAHYVTVLPHEDRTIPEGSEVLLVRREGDVFYAITDDAPALGAIG
jgi:membrane protein implicated in regulation of membrane protease activity